MCIHRPADTKKATVRNSAVRLPIRYKRREKGKSRKKCLSAPNYPFGLFCNSYSSPRKRQSYGSYPYDQEKLRKSFSFGGCPFCCRTILAKISCLQLLMKTAPLSLILHQVGSFYHGSICLSTGKLQISYNFDIIHLISYISKISSA